MERNQHRGPGTLIATLLAALVALAVVGCGVQDSSSPPAAPASSSSAGSSGGGSSGGSGGTTGQPTLSLATPSPATITAGASGSTLTATLLDAAGAAASGATVTFSVSPSSVGTLSATSRVTNASGQAVATLTGTAAGTARVTVSSSGATSVMTSVTVLAPSVTIAAADAQIGASVPGAGGTVVTATVTDSAGTGIDGLTVAMQSTLGSLTSVSGVGSGQYQATLTSQQVGTADLSATVLGATSPVANVTVIPAALSSFVLSPNPSQIVLGATSSLNVTAQDAFGNAVSGTVDFELTTTPAGIATLSETQVALVDGAAAVTLTGADPGTASVKATLDGSSQTEEVVVVEDLNGVPALVSIEVDPAEITVGDEASVVTVTMTDIFGAPITDVANNVELEIISGPSDVVLGGKAIGEVLLASSAGGVVSASLQSGTMPGTVRIEARVVRKMGPTGVEPVSPAITPAEPAKVLIQSGPPFSLYLGRSTRIVNNSDGTYTQGYFANVSDRFGNAVRDGTSVYMGQFINILALGSGGSVTAEGTTLTAGSAVSSRYPGTFGGVVKDDTVAVLSGESKGGYLISAAASGSVETRSAFGATDGAADYAAGNNGGPGGPVLDTGAESFTVSGKATWLNTYPVEQINELLVVHAETQGRTVTDARLFRLGYIDVPAVSVEVLGPTSAAAGDALDFEVTVRDAGDPKIPIGDLTVDVTVDIPAASVGVGDGDFDGGSGNNGSNSVTIFTGRYNELTWGTTTFTWNVPLGASSAEVFVLTIKAGNRSTTTSVLID